ncbi:hypothetical protein IG631_07628 [Alternaria alternata]|jgi:hypothetical protein|nr:hypothetical protein IG631_07628 [Alternaria alternata]
MEGRCRVALLSRNSRTVVSPDRAPITTQMGYDCPPAAENSTLCWLQHRQTCREVVRCKRVKISLDERMARAEGEGMLAAQHPGGQNAACWVG